MFSAWYLYIGGIATKTLGFFETLVAIAIANIVFVLIFTFYAGTNKPKDVLFKEAFGEKSARYFISFLPTLTQIGWYAVVLEIGGSALAFLLGLEKWSLAFNIVLFCYGLFTMWIASGGLSSIGKLSYASIPAMLGFTAWGAYTVFDRLGINGLLTYQPPNVSAVSLAVGIQILLAAFISAAVTIPDFLHDLGTKKNIFWASFWGLIPTALLVGGLGAAFAIVGKSYDVLATMQIINGPLLIYALLSIDNLCGAQAVFPVGTGFASVFCNNKDTPQQKESSRKFWTFAGGLISVGLAIIGIVGHLEVWLKILGTVFAPIIGVVLANQYIVKKDFSCKKLHLSALLAWALGCGISFIPFGVPILNSLVLSAIAFAFIDIARH